MSKFRCKIYSAYTNLTRVCRCIGCLNVLVVPNFFCCFLKSVYCIIYIDVYNTENHRIIEAFGLEGSPKEVQYLALSSVEAYDVLPMDPFLSLVQVPLDGIPSFRCVSYRTQLGVTLKLAEGALSSFFYTIHCSIKECWS